MQRRPFCKKIWLVAAFVSISWLSGCVSVNQQTAKIDYYTLEYPPPIHAAASPLPVVLKVKRFSAAPDFKSDRMVYREQDYSRNTYFYHRWRSTPADLATYFLGRDLRASGLFRGVVRPESGIGVTHVIEGEVSEFIEEDGSESWNARLDLSVTLLMDREPDPAKRVIFQKQFTVVEPCESRNPVAVARAMSAAMSRISTEVGTAVHLALKKAD